MKITVLNGSPKGKKSTTLHSVLYLQKRFPGPEWKIHHISQRIRGIEKDGGSFREILEDVRSSDGVVWCSPVYVTLVPSQYKRFIELVFERGGAGAFRGKAAAVLTTSVHFFDHTAVNYLNGICDDLEMRFAGAFSADMYDLLKRKERERLDGFGESFLRFVGRGLPAVRRHAPPAARTFVYEPGEGAGKVDPGGKKVVLITDAREGDGNLKRMAERFAASFSEKIEVFNLYDLDIRGGCLGCCRCGPDGRCAYEGKDGYIDFYRNRVMTADIVVLAGTVRDRFLSWKWKQFLDRRFFRNHIPTLEGKQMGFIVSGPLSQIGNLREILEAYAQWERAGLAGWVTDEYGGSPEIDALLDALAERLVESAGKGYVAPRTFLGEGAAKLFRDEIWGRLRVVFQTDHRYYRKHRFYDFPQKRYRMRARNMFLMLLTRIPRVRKAFQEKMVDGMVAPHRKIIERM
jgi:multimeric flavodoxin WrbA